MLDLVSAAILVGLLDGNTPIFNNVRSKMQLSINTVQVSRFSLAIAMEGMHSVELYCQVRE